MITISSSDLDTAIRKYRFLQNLPEYLDKLSNYYILYHEVKWLNSNIKDEKLICRDIEYNVAYYGSLNKEVLRELKPKQQIACSYRVPLDKYRKLKPVVLLSIPH